MTQPLFVSPPSLLSNASIPKRRRALFVCSEMNDFIKAGGLGDVAASLPRALLEMHDVRVLLPGYRAVREKAGPLEVVATIPGYAGLPGYALAKADRKGGLVVYVVLQPELFEREGSPYADPWGKDWTDNPKRFATLAHAAAQLAMGAEGEAWKPEVLHLNDWPAALAAGYLRWWGCPVPCLLTIHNLAYQGLFSRAWAPELGIPEEALDEIGHHGQLSFLKAGLVHSAHLNTVSTHYAHQITSVEHGCGLEGLLYQKANQGLLTGIINGIDETWDPKSDSHLVAPFERRCLTGRKTNATHVRHRLGMRPSTGPLFAVVSRLVHQKGLDLICEVAPQLASAGAQLIVVGCGEPALEKTVRQLEAAYPSRVAAFVGFEETLARQLFAGADFLLMPSRFEPCGLSQMYAQRFGCLPLAHATGGLVDTIEDGVTGFLFDTHSADGLRRAVVRALRTFERPSLLRAMQMAAMARTAGWQSAAGEYARLYERLVGQG